MKLVVATIAAAALLLVATPIYADTHPPHWTDGTTFDSQTNFGPPPIAPRFAPGEECKQDIIDPSSFVFVTEHFVYGTTAPAAGVVPVQDDTSAVFNYVGSAPGTFPVNVTSDVAGKQGFRADTWNLGAGVTPWVPFDCTTPATTTTTTEQTTTTTTPVTPPNVMPPATPVPAQPQLTG